MTARGDSKMDLLRDRPGKSAEDRQLFEELRDPTTGSDMQHLHRALFAAYDDNRGMAADEVRQALAETDGRLSVIAGSAG